MALGPDVGMASQKMMENMQQDEDVLLVPARLSCANVV
jgi:hypothetical protein